VEKMVRIFVFILLTIFFLALLINILYWGLIIIGALIGIWAYVVIGTIAALLIVGYVRVIKGLSRRQSSPSQSKGAV